MQDNHCACGAKIKADETVCHHCIREAEKQQSHWGAK